MSKSTYCRDYELAQAKLVRISQQHLLRFWPELSIQQRTFLHDQVEAIDIDLFLKQRQFLNTKSFQREYVPFVDVSRESAEDYSLGLKAISEGYVGCLVVAGGQGTRLGFSGPKGAFPVTSFKHKSLFQLIAEKTLAAGRLVRKDLLLAVMTSHQNHIETLKFFEENHYFGLKRNQLAFFSQGELPLLDEDGNLFLERMDRIAFGPDGNGSSLYHFFESGLWNHWRDRGIKQVNFILIDNALADPFDAALIGRQLKSESEVTVKCIEKRDPDEKVGVMVLENGKVAVVEYSEMSEEDRKARQADGGLKYQLANISTFCFSMDFIKKAAEKPVDVWHLAHKVMATTDSKGNSVSPSTPNAWKYEYFIFDYLAMANRVTALLCDREHCYAPLKNAQGTHSLKTVQEALLKHEINLISGLTGQKLEAKNIELAQGFYYPTTELKSHWQSRQIEHDGFIPEE